MDTWSKHDLSGATFTSLAIVILVAVVVWEIRKEVANRKLLKNGECSLAEVTFQKTVGRQRQSRIEYAFADRSGETNIGAGDDQLRLDKEKMTVPVFYDPECPSKNVATCCTRWTIYGVDAQ